MPVKIDPDIVEELAQMNLVLWDAKHPKRPFFNEKTGKQSQREDKGWVIVSLNGPGVDREKPAGGPTLRQAVDHALRTYFSDRVPGLRGDLLRLEKACFDLTIGLMSSRSALSGCSDDDDEIPF